MISYLHTGLTVSDIKRSREFYAGLLGLKELLRPGHDFKGSWYAIGNAQLHLFTAPDLVPGKSETDDFELRAPHVALAVVGWETLVEKLKAAHVPVRFLDSVDGRRRVFVKDPDGNMIELVECTAAAAPTS